MELTIGSQEETWATNANAFVAHEDDDTQAYGVRVAGFELLYVSLGINVVQIKSETLRRPF